MTTENAATPQIDPQAGSQARVLFFRIARMATASRPPSDIPSDQLLKTLQENIDRFAYRFSPTDNNAPDLTIN